LVLQGGPGDKLIDKLDPAQSALGMGHARRAVSSDRRRCVRRSSRVASPLRRGDRRPSARGSLLRTPAADVIGKQLLRCATSVGANYQAACRGRSPSEFIAKMSIVEEEADESIYWLELLADSGISPREKLADLMGEADQLVRIIVASIRTARSRDKGLP
jgi:four helix bundle protein